MDIFNFENVVAYQRAMDLVELVYELLKKFLKKNNMHFVTNCDAL